MKEFRRNFIIYCITNFIWASVFNLWYSFLPKYYAFLGASSIVVGFLFSLERISEGISNIFGGYFADKYGRKSVIILGSFLGNLSLLIFFNTTSWVWLIPAIIFFWVTVGIQSPTIAALINESLEKGKRAKGFSILSILATVPAIFATPLGGMLIEGHGLPEGVKFSLFTSFFVGMACTLVYVFFLKETLLKKREKKTKSKWKLSRKVFYFVASYGLLMFSVSLVSPYVIFYSQDVIGISMLDWGIVGSFFTMFVLFFTLLGGIISDKFGRKFALLLSFFSIFFPFTLLLSKNLIGIIIAHIFAATLTLGSSSIPVYVFEKSRFAKSIGLVNLSLAIAMVLGYPVGGFLYSLSPTYPFLASGLIRILGLLIGIFLV